MSREGAPLLLDTCAAIWVDSGEPISPEAIKALHASARDGKQTYLSPMTAWEAGMLVAKGRLNLWARPEVWFNEMLGLRGVRLAALTPDILILSSFLPGLAPKDPVDRIMAATARELGYRLMTRDQVLLEYAAEGHMLAIAC